MSDLKINLGKKIRKLRLQNKLSQEALAEKIDIAVTNMGKIERGESFLTAATLEKLAKVLNVKYKDIFDFDEYTPVEEMKKELDLNSMPEEDINKIYRFYKKFLKD